MFHLILGLLILIPLFGGIVLVFFGLRALVRLAIAKLRDLRGK